MKNFATPASSRWSRPKRCRDSRPIATAMSLSLTVSEKQLKTDRSCSSRTPWSTRST